MYGFESVYKSFVNGDLAPFYRNLYPALLVYASRYLGEELAYLGEDCVQEAVVDVFLMSDRFDGPKQWYTYLLKSITTKALMNRRKLSSYHNYVESGSFDDSSPGFEADLLERETLTRLYMAIESLTPMQRDILRMNYIEGMKNADIAKALGVAEITIKKQKAKMIAQLRDKMGDIPMVILALYAWAV